MNEGNSLWSRLFIFEWERRLTALFTGIFLLQFVYWISKEDGLWLPETVRIVEYTLLITFLIHIIPFIHYSLRGILHVASVIWISAALLNFHWISPSGRSILDFVTANVLGLTPYLWFGLVACVLYLLTIWWVGVKWRIYTLILVSVLAFAVRDSFSILILWQQMAMILFSGLFLVAVSHFQGLKRKAPRGWQSLSEYPLSIAVPVAALVTFTIVAGSLAPEIRPLLTDPYSAWRAMKGQGVAFTTGKGYEVAPLSKQETGSGYSRNDQALGGGFNFDYTPVMTVSTSDKSYWRGETRSNYTGRGWEPSLLDRRASSVGIMPDNVLPGDHRTPGSRLKTVEVKQTFMFTGEEPYPYPVLFGASPISRLESVNSTTDNFDSFVWVPRQAEIRVRKKEPINQYTLVSKVPVIDEDILKTVPMDALNRGEFNDALQLPQDLPVRVKQLAEDITSPYDTPYEKAKALEQYLKTKFPYNNKPDLSKGVSRDFVDRFLFEIKEGYCDYYSSAMVVMARSVGLPARWVKGYAPGERIQDQYSREFQDPQASVGSGPGNYTVRNSDAHSWAEVYFSGIGWLQFEPTAGFTVPLTTAPSEPAADMKTEPVTAAPALPEKKKDDYNGWIYAASAVVLAAFAAAAVWYFGFTHTVGAWFTAKKAFNYRQKVIVECEKMLRVSRSRGYIREEHETVREAVKRWIAGNRQLRADLEQMLALFEKAKYGNASITEQDWLHAARIVDKLKTNM